MSSAGREEVRKRRGGLPQHARMRHGSHFVEELTLRDEHQVGRLIALSAIEADAQQPRGTLGDLKELVASIEEMGVLQPILIRPNPEAGSGRAPYRIISGERRYRAALEAGLFEIPAIEMEVSEQEALEIALIENLQRKDLTPFEEADGYRALAELYGYTHDQVAKAVGKSRVSITEALALLALPAKVRDAAQALGVGSKSVLLGILGAGSEGKQLALLEEVARHGLRRKDLRARKRATRGRRRRAPHVFRFKDPERHFQLAITFRQSEVDHDDLIGALEKILTELRAEKARV